MVKKKNKNSNNDRLRKSNKLILRSKRNRAIRKVIICTVIIAAGAITFAVKSNFFIVNKINIVGNPTMSGDDVKKNTENIIGQNIFFINKNNIIKDAKKNAYVDNVEITKTYPKQINLKITEKQGIYYIEDSGYKYVLDDQGNILEKTDNIQDRKLVHIIGLSMKNVEPGNKAIDDKRILKTLDIFNKIIKKNPTNYSIDSIDLNDFTNIKVYIGSVEGRLGNDENIPEKMNKLLHIVGSPDIGITKGYVNVGFNGSPIYYKER